MSEEEAQPISLVDAAARVLKEFANKQAMHYQDIVNIAISQGWISGQELRPGVSLASAIGQENKRREARGEKLRFFAAGRGFYGLSGWQDDPAGKARKQEVEAIEAQMLSSLRKMHPYRFEEVIAILLDRMGFVNVQLKGRTGDRGIDIEADLKVQEFGTIKTIVQVKRYKDSIGSEIVRNLIGAFTRESEAGYGLLITTAKFTKEARIAAKQARVSIWLVDGEELVRLMMQYKIGVKERVEYDIDPGFFEPTAFDERRGGSKPKGRVLAESAPALVDAISVAEPAEDYIVAAEEQAAVEAQIPAGLLLSATLKSGRSVEAIAGADNHIVYNDVEYNSPDEAAAVASGKQRDGWNFWGYQDPDSGEWLPLDALLKG